MLSFDYPETKLGLSYDVSDKLTIGVLRETTQLGDNPEVFTIASEFKPDANHSVKVRLDHLGVFALYHRAKLNSNFDFSTLFRTGLNPDHKINGTLGSNYQVGFKLAYNE